MRAKERAKTRVKTRARATYEGSGEGSSEDKGGGEGSGSGEGRGSSEDEGSGKGRGEDPWHRVWAGADWEELEGDGAVAASRCLHSKKHPLFCPPPCESSPGATAARLAPAIP